MVVNLVVEVVVVVMVEVYMEMVVKVGGMGKEAGKWW